MKPSVQIETPQDLKVFLEFFTDGNYGLWLDNEGVFNVMLPRGYYRELRNEIMKRLVEDDLVKIHKQSFWNYLKFKLRGGR